MDPLIDLLDVLARTLDRTPLLVLWGLTLLWVPPLVLLHELGHAAAAIGATEDRVTAHVGRGPELVAFSLGRCRVSIGPLLLPGGHCEYDPSRLRRGRDEAWIALAGPLTSLLAAVTLTVLALAAETSPVVSSVFVAGAMCAAGHAVMSALPIRYGIGSGAAGGDSDGLAAWRILTGGLRQPALSFGRPVPTGPPVRPVYAVLLLLIAVATLAMSLTLGLLLVFLFTVAWLLQRADERADASQES